MRVMPFMKRKKGIQFAGVGLDTGGGGGGSGYDYSELSETVVGKWVDGKPLFRKGFAIPTLSSAITDISSYVPADAIVHNFEHFNTLDGGNDLFTQNRYIDSSYYAIMDYAIRNNKPSIYYRYSGFTLDAGGYAYIYYTKTE